MVLGLHLGLRLGLHFCPCKNEMYRRGVAFGVAFYDVSFRFQPYKLPKWWQNTAFSYVFAYQNNKAHRIRGALLIVKSYKIATYRVLGCRRAYISKEFADTAQHFVHFDDAALVELLLIKALCIDGYKKKFVRVF